MCLFAFVIQLTFAIQIITNSNRVGINNKTVPPTTLLDDCNASSSAFITFDFTNTSGAGHIVQKESGLCLTVATSGTSYQPMRKQGTVCGTKACLENHGQCIAGSITIDVATGPLTTVPVLATGTSRTTSPHRPTRTSAA